MSPNEIRILDKVIIVPKDPIQADKFIGMWRKAQYEAIAEFYNKFLLKNKWTEKYDITILWLLEHCGCEHIRMTIGKKKLSVIKLKQFEKEQTKIKDRKFKKEDSF